MKLLRSFPFFLQMLCVWFAFIDVSYAMKRTPPADKREPDLFCKEKWKGLWEAEAKKRLQEGLSVAGKLNCLIEQTDLEPLCIKDGYVYVIDETYEIRAFNLQTIAVSFDTDIESLLSGESMDVDLDPEEIGKFKEIEEAGALEIKKRRKLCLMYTIEVAQNERRKGIGTQLIRLAKKHFPNFAVQYVRKTEYDQQFYLTDNGQRLVDSCLKDGTLSPHDIVDEDCIKDEDSIENDFHDASTSDH